MFGFFALKKKKTSLQRACHEACGEEEVEAVELAEAAMSPSKCTSENKHFERTQMKFRTFCYNDIVTLTKMVVTLTKLVVWCFGF